MTFKQFLILLMAATALLWAGWVWTLFSVDPLATNWLGFLLFYLTLFLAATGTLCLAAVAVRKWRQPNLMLYHVVARSFRQAVALSFFSLALLMLQGTRALRWWNALALLLFVAGLETIVLRRHDKRGSSGSSEAPPAEPVNEEGPTPLFIRKEME
jgi:hypothetical protein